jgi:hypothetical protein
MSKPVGYYAVDFNKPLVQNMLSEWGEGLTGMDASDSIWLIARIAHHLWTFCDELTTPSSEAETVADNLYQLSENDLFGLIQVLANKDYTNE